MSERAPMVRTRSSWPWSLVVGLGLLTYLAISAFTVAEYTVLHLVAAPVGFVLAAYGLVKKIRADLRSARANAE